MSEVLDMGFLPRFLYKCYPSYFLVHIWRDKCPILYLALRNMSKDFPNAFRAVSANNQRLSLFARSVK